MYKIFYWANLNQKGKLYLKAFEPVDNIELSTNRLRKKTEMRVNKNDPKSYTKEFTIYEGTWGQKYVGRLEIWFEPENGQEYKLTEDLFLIEGWMR